MVLEDPGDHPRVCGEQIFKAGIYARPKGSPPRVRGTDTPQCRPFLLLRITPACAGNSMNFFYPCNKFRDHPRVCGEQK